MKPVRIRIKDMEWVVEVIEDLKYEERHGKDSHGLTHKEKKYIHLKKSNFSIELIRHEVLHAYCSSCCIDSADISVEDFEEIVAEIVAYHGEDICKHSRKLYNTLKPELEND